MGTVNPPLPRRSNMHLLRNGETYYYLTLNRDGSVEIKSMVMDHTTEVPKGLFYSSVEDITPQDIERFKGYIKAVRNGVGDLFTQVSTPLVKLMTKLSVSLEECEESFRKHGEKINAGKRFKEAVEGLINPGPDDGSVK